jgi:hypothetical protein
MKKLKISAISALLALFALSHAAVAADDPVLTQLPNAKISLLDGIKQAEKASGPVISAKFELDDSGKLSLSIYTAPAGLNTPAEANPMTELSGDPTVLPFAPGAEVFADKEHIARASTHLAVMQLSRLSLVEIIDEALEVQKGLPYSVVNPMIRNHKAVADVFILDRKGKSVQVTVNVQTGEAYVN